MTVTTERVALVTGASRGFGLAVARRLGDDGWHLVIDARKEGPLEEARSDLASRTEVSALSGDVSDPAHRSRLVDAAREWGRLDLVVNNASILGPSPQPALPDYAIDDLRAVFEVNVLAVLGLTQEALPLLRQSGGVVLNLTSDAASEPYQGWGGYGSSKAALNQLTNILGAEEPDISVYALDPGDMNTQMHQEAFPGEDISDRPAPEESVPALMRLVVERPPSGHYRAADLLASA